MIFSDILEHLKTAASEIIKEKSFQFSFLQKRLFAGPVTKFFKKSSIRCLLNKIVD